MDKIQSPVLDVLLFLVGLHSTPHPTHAGVWSGHAQ